MVVKYVLADALLSYAQHYSREVAVTSIVQRPPGPFIPSKVTGVQRRVTLIHGAESCSLPEYRGVDVRPRV